MLHFERLDVYRFALQLVAITDRIAAEVSEEHAYLVERLRHFAFAVPPSVAAGTSITGVEERARHFGDLRGSAFGCAATLDILGVVRAAPKAQCDEARQLLERIVALLSKMSGTGANAACRES